MPLPLFLVLPFIRFRIPISLPSKEILNYEPTFPKVDLSNIDESGATSEEGQGSGRRPAHQPANPPFSPMCFEKALKAALNV